MQNYDAIIIGAGHNGLVTAAYLAKSRMKVLVLERRTVIGGIGATEEIFPDYKYSTCTHLAGAFSNNIIAELDLKKHGLEILSLDPMLFAPSLGGPPLQFLAKAQRPQKKSVDFPGLMPVNSILFARSLRGYPVSWRR